MQNDRKVNNLIVDDQPSFQVLEAILKDLGENLLRMTEEVKRLNDKIRETDRRKNEFLAMLGHELRNPLAPMLNALHILRHSGNDPATIEQMHDLLQRQVHNMSRLVDDLVDVSRISRGKIELRKRKVELGAIIARALECSRPLFVERSQHLEVVASTEPLWLDADAMRLEQILSNLLNNAAKCTDPGGNIWLTVETASATSGTSGSPESTSKGEVIIKVRDSGIGIPPEMLDQIFDLFVLVDNTRGSQWQWEMVIGTAMVRILVELHGGTVRADSPGVGKGSEFVVRLPRVEP